jgi:hypothetical protein
VRVVASEVEAVLEQVAALEVAKVAASALALELVVKREAMVASVEHVLD